MEYQRFVGIDLGKRTMEVRILEGRNKPIKWNGKTDIIGRKRLYRLLKKGDCVAIEACSLAFKIARELQDKVDVVVLNPRKLALIYQSKKKTDSEDAMKLAWLIRRIPVEELPVVPLMSEDETDARAAVHEKSFTVGERTRYINRLHSVFVSQGITTMKKSNLKSAPKRRESIELLTGRGLLEAKRLIEIIDVLEEQLADLDEERTEILRSNELTPIVMSVPGVGPDTALAFLAFIGTGERFSKSSEVSNYIGLVPKVDQSGDITRYGHINKREGCAPVRRVIVQAAWALVRSSEGGHLAEKYQELRDRRGAGIAIVATARKMGEMLWAMVKTRTNYWFSDNNKYIKKLKNYKLDNFIEKGQESA